MTTAHRPTFNAALGGPAQGGNTDVVKTEQKKRAEEAKKSKVPKEDADEDLVSTDDDDDDDDDEADETAELMRELERIKRERAEEQERKNKAAQEAAEKERMEAILSGNPLLNTSSAAVTGGEFKTKRRWDDDVVFRNQTRTEPEPKKRFINDMLRSDFHKRFMNKYIK